MNKKGLYWIGPLDIPLRHTIPGFSGWSGYRQKYILYLGEGHTQIAEIYGNGGVYSGSFSLPGINTLYIKDVDLDQIQGSFAVHFEYWLYVAGLGFKDDN